VLKFINLRFALFTPPLGDFHSAWSALPLEASLAQLQNSRVLCDELEPEAAVSAWTEAESAREEDSSAQERVASQAEEVLQRRLELGQIVR
jgi:hypothetical protein